MAASSFSERSEPEQLLHFRLQKRTASQQSSHFFRQKKVRPQWGQVLERFFVEMST